jgi:CheY-like chemotaxis protein
MPDVVVSDLAMPGLDGYALIHQIRRRPEGSDVPAVAPTAHANADARAKAFSAGFDTYIAKPVDPTELVALVTPQARRGPGGGSE